MAERDLVISQFPCTVVRRGIFYETCKDVVIAGENYVRLRHFLFKVVQ